MFKSIFENARLAAHEMSEMERLLKPENKSLREIVVYAERDIYWQYYSDFVRHILATSDKHICYLSSDLEDPIFKTTEPRIKPFYIKNSLAAVFERLDSKVILMTTPDLNKGAVKRAPNPVHHVYVFHGISSLHQGYRLGGLDHYDSLLCVAQYQADEMRRIEEIYSLPAKLLPVIGYPLVERIYREHKDFIASNPAHEGSNRVCLVAPTWDPQQKASIMDVCIDELMDALSKSEMTVWLRPHPEYIKRFPKRIDAVRKRIAKSPNISLQLEVGSMQCLHEADVLITDHSTIAMDYVIGTERPVLYIDTPVRIDNPESEKLGIEAIENTYRSAMGARVAPENMKDVVPALAKLLANKQKFQDTVPMLRDALVANWQHSAEAGGDFILDLCK